MLEADETSEDERPVHMTGRLALRMPRQRDAAALAIAVGNPRVAMSLFDVPYPYGHADAEGWIERARVPSRSPGTTLVAFRHCDAALVGAGFHRPSDAWPDGFELSFWVAEPFWGRGFGTEIAHAVIDDAFEGGGEVRLPVPGYRPRALPRDARHGSGRALRAGAAGLDQPQGLGTRQSGP